MNKNYKCGTNM